ncbi:hypothetical protein CPA54_00690 [Parasaccharibacter sp. TMW2.1890]|nr:hypothetical protein [Parasaccharibacter sp. TMW2.1890]
MSFPESKPYLRRIQTLAGNPKPVVATGTYLVDIASLTVDPRTKRATISNPKYNVEATFTTHTPTGRNDKKVQDFTFQDPQTKKQLTGSYDYSWGNKSVNGFIIGNGSGGYYIITSAVPGSSSSTIDGATLLDPSEARYTYINDSSRNWANGNFFDLDLNGQHYYFHQDNDGTATDGALNEQFTFNTCFLAGSLIETPDGPRKVEELKTGDVILTHNPISGQTLPQRLTWAGRSRLRITSSPHMDMAGYPVRIRKDALADGVPSEDLLVTAEHCLFLDDRFVPARMLVNGRSIHFEMTDRIRQMACDIFHIETEMHSVIFANDVMTESYLDTGNRYQFVGSSHDSHTGNVITHDFSTRKRSWYRDAAAPLCTAREFVAPLHQGFLQRAEELSFPIQHPYKAEALCEDPAFHLVTDRGEVLHEKRTSAGYRLFSIPLGTTHVTLVSRTGRPCDTHGPFVDDRRTLGVLVGEILHFQATHSTSIDTHLTTDQLDGWCGLENPSMRWTQGAARLPLPSQPEYNDGVETGLLAIQIMAAGPYPLSANNSLEDEADMTTQPGLVRAV